MATSPDLATRWTQEAAFFDQEAERVVIRPIHPETLVRYGQSRRRRFNKEFRFRLMGDVAGKRVLDVGCGDGLNALTFAALGATVTGIDISPQAIAVARRRVELNGVEGRATFVCAPFEMADLPEASFDIVWCDAILHHLLHDFDASVGRLVRYAKPGGLVMLGEPTNLSPTLRAIRRHLPIHTDATPDERPLEAPEIAVLRRHLPRLQVRHFSLFERFNRFVLRDHTYEGASWPRKLAQNLLAGLDYAVLSVPPLARLGATSVMWARVE